LLVTGCGGDSPADSTVLPGGQAITGKTILVLIDSPPVPAWEPALNGVKAAEGITGLKARVVFAPEDRQMVAEIHTAIAAHVDGIVLDVQTPTADAAICAANAAGIPVVAWNTDGYGGTAERCVSAFIGQDVVSAGQLIAQYMADHGHIKQGAHVFCPVENPIGAATAHRVRGVNSVLASFDARCDVVRVGFDDAGVQSSMIHYLGRHPDTNLVITLGGIPLANAPMVLKRLGRHIPVAGFDTSDPRIIKGIEDGTIAATVDQEFYSQTFQALMQLALYLKYGLFPSDVDTSENSVVDNTNAALAASLSGTYR
jgi:simple sugar transport system substrate-binding protein